MEDRLKDFKVSLGIAASRIPKEGVGSMNINSYIASLTAVGNISIDNSETDKIIKKNMDRAVGMYSYLRDTTGAQTVQDAYDSLFQRKVDEKVVKLWVEEGMAVNPGEFDAIANGYPELKEILEKVRKEKLDKHLNE